jgi:hypothetical protein
VAKAPNPETRLASFISKYTPAIASLAESILQKMRSRYPNAIEIVYDNYNAFAIGFGPSERASEVIFSITLYPKWASLFFMQAKGLPDPKCLLKGSGTVAKHVILSSPNALDDASLMDLMQQAVQRAAVPLSAAPRHRLVIKSVSEKQRPRRPPESKKQGQTRNFK